MIRYYYENKNMDSLDTVIEDVFSENGKFYVRLKDSLFYPQGGGQKGDRGTITVDGKAYQVSNSVKDENGDSVCIVSEEAEKSLIGKPCLCELDRTFRNRQMKLHTCLHVYHMLMEEVKGGAMDYPVLSTIEDGFAVNKYKEDAFEAEKLPEVTERFHQLLETDTQVITYPDEKDNNYRYWKCLDTIIPCGGIHVDHLNEIGEVSVEVKHKKKEISIRITLK